MLSPWS